MGDSINKDSPIPYYLQLKNLIISKINNNEFPRNKLWAEHKFSREYGVNVATVRRALSEIKREGMLYTAKGVGTFVIKPKLEFDLSKFLSFGRVLRDKGIEEEITVLNKGIIKCEESLFEGYAVRNPSEKVAYIERVRSINNEPIVYEKIFLNNDLCSPIIKENDNILVYDYLVNNLKINIKSIEEYIEPKNLDLVESKILSMKKGNASFFVTRVSYDAEDRCIEFRKVIIRGDKCRFYMKLK